MVRTHFRMQLGAVAIILSLFASSVIPAPAHAIDAEIISVGAVEGTVVASSIINTAAAADTSAGAEVEQSVISKILNGLAWTVAKTAIQSLTKSIVVWINSGFNGSPAFATDLSRNLRQLGDAVAQSYLTELANESAVHSPFIDNLVTNVGAGYYLYSSRDAIASQLRYTLNQSAQDDAAFLNGDFDQGGWNAWFSTFMNPANNPYGAQMIAADALANQVAQAANQRVTELGWGSGFMSWRGDCIATAEGQLAQDLGDADPCLKYEIQTPGSVIENTLNITQSSPLRQLELADSVNEIVGALAQQMVSQVIGGTGLRGISQPSQGGGVSVLTQATNPNQYAANGTSFTAGFDQNLATTRAKVLAYKANWTKIQDAAKNAQNACSSSNNTNAAGSIEAALARAASALARADASIASIDGIAASSRAAAGSSPAEQSALLAKLSSDYLALTSGSSLPTASELTEAATEAGSSASSLFSRMTAFAQNNCRVTSAD